MRPIVSIIIPTRNRGALLRAALGSVASQTFDDWQVIVVDDGSEEDLGPVIDSFAGPIRRIRIAKSGPAAARNVGIDAADTEYLAFLDSDDLWLPDHLFRGIELLRREPRVGLVYHGAEAIDQAGRVVGQRKARREPSGWVAEPLLAYDFIPTPSVICRREVLQQAGCFDEALPCGEDYDLWLRMSLLCEFGRVDEPLMQRRLHADNLSRRNKARAQVARAVLKERFCQRPQVRGVVRESFARAVLGEAFRRAGRGLLLGGWPVTARRFLRRGLHYRPLCPRAWVLLGRAWWDGGANGADDPGAEILRRTGHRLDGEEL